MDKEVVGITRKDLSELCCFLEEQEIPIDVDKVFLTSIYIDDINCYLDWNSDTDSLSNDVLNKIIGMINTLLPIHELRLED